MILVPMEGLNEGIQGIKAGVCIFPRSGEGLASSLHMWICLVVAIWWIRV